MDITPLHHKLKQKLKELLTFENVNKEIIVYGVDEGVQEDSFTFRFYFYISEGYFIIDKCSFGTTFLDYETGYAEVSEIESPKNYKTLIDIATHEIIIDDVISEYNVDDVLNFSHAIYNIFFRYMASTILFFISRRKIIYFYGVV